MPGRVSAAIAPPAGPRWRIAGMGCLLQIGLGTVYAWSYFQTPLAEAFASTQSAAAWVFSLAICCLGLAAAVGGILLPRTGPRPLALAGAALYPLGWLIGGEAIARGSLPLLYLGFGVIGGCGLGLAYVTPVATAARWFPDRKGLATGLVVMGFGLGALAMSKLIAPWLMQACAGDLAAVFRWSAAAIAAICLPAAAVLRLPAAPAPAAAIPAAGGAPPLAGVRSLRFLRLWLIFACNIAAGIMLIGFQSPLLQDLLRRADPSLAPAALAAAGATLIAASALCNGIGRIAWGALADRIGRIAAFRLILATQAAAFIALALAPDPWLFAALTCYVLLCYGGGFGVMPSCVLDAVGPAAMPAAYGCILTAWSVAGIVGPQAAALIRDHADPAAAGMWIFAAGAGLLAAGFAIALAEPAGPRPGVVPGGRS